MMVLVLPLIVFLSSALLGFAIFYRSVPMASLNVCALITIGFFLQPWSLFSPPLVVEDNSNWRWVIFIWFAFLVISILAVPVLFIVKKKRHHHKHRRYTF